MNLDFPDTCDTFLHRCGRTGRAGRSGVALSYITVEDGAVVPSIINALESAGCPPDATLVNVAAAFRERRAFSKGFAQQKVSQLTRPRFRETLNADASILLGDDDAVVRTLQQQQAQQEVNAAHKASAADRADGSVIDASRQEFLQHLRRKYLSGEQDHNTFKRV